MQSSKINLRIAFEIGDFEKKYWDKILGQFFLFNAMKMKYQNFNLNELLIKLSIADFDPEITIISTELFQLKQL